MSSDIQVAGRCFREIIIAADLNLPEKAMGSANKHDEFVAQPEMELNTFVNISGKIARLFDGLQQQISQ